jgi:hypothetical protein
MFVLKINIKKTSRAWVTNKIKLNPIVSTHETKLYMYDVLLSYFNISHNNNQDNGSHT